MISLDSEAYLRARSKVKICEFSDRGLPLTGVVHVGANDGYEVEWYRSMDLAPIVCFEPLPAATKKFRQHYSDDPQVVLVEAALGESDGKSSLTITAGDGQGSSLLPTDWAPHGYVPIGKVEVPLLRFDTWAKDNHWESHKFNTLMIDVQGYEQQVLLGFGALLHCFQNVCVECSEVPLYFGGAPAHEVCSYLESFGFTRLTDIKSHDDILFVRAG